MWKGPRGFPEHGRWPWHSRPFPSQQELRVSCSKNPLHDFNPPSMTIPAPFLPLSVCLSLLWILHKVTEDRELLCTCVQGSWLGVELGQGAAGWVTASWEEGFATGKWTQLGLMRLRVPSAYGPVNSATGFLLINTVEQHLSRALAQGGWVGTVEMGHKD